MVGRLHKHLMTAAAIALVAAPGASAQAAPQGVFTALPGALSGRHSVSARTAPLDDGRVLFVGTGVLTDQAEVFDPTTGAFTTIGDEVPARNEPAVAPLPDGRVLVAGGQIAGPPSASAQIFDPATREWTATGSMSTPRTQAAAAPLPDGRVLVAGGHNNGDDLSSAEIFDPATGTFSPTGNLAYAAFEGRAAPLQDGRVLIVDPYGAQLFDPTTGKFTRTSHDPVAARGNPAVAPLPDGRVLIVGGRWSQDFERSTEVFDPATETFTLLSTSTSARSQGAAALLPDGRVLLAGGYDPDINIAGSEVFKTPAEAVWDGADFGSQAIGRPSAVIPVRVSNRGVQLLRITGASLAGTAAGDYAIIRDGCKGRALGFQQSCDVSVRFTPSAEGQRPARIDLVDNAGGSPHQIELSGAGVQSERGPQGEPGAPGAQGAAGPVGSAGATGPAGSDGSPGPAGPGGSAGSVGSAGTTVSSDPSSRARLSLVSRSLKAARNGIVPVQVRNTGAGATTGRVAITVGGSQLGSAAFDAAAGQTRSVRIRLSRDGRRLLARRRKLRVTIELAGGSSTVSKRRVVLAAG